MEEVEKVITQVHDDLINFLEIEPSIEIFQSLRFDQGNIPDYSEPLIQQMYLLRYLFAYAYEYYGLFNCIIENLEFELYPKTRILSIGCGMAIDYLALRKTMDDYPDTKDTLIDYIGVDLVDWLYRFDSLKSDNFKFHKQDINCWMKSHKFELLSRDIIIFPKSISEFTEEQFNALICSMISIEGEFSRNRIVLCGSFRKTDSNNYLDRKRFDCFVDKFSIRFKMNVAKVISTTKENGVQIVVPQEDFISHSDRFSRFPDQVLDTMLNLYKFCNRFKEQNQIHCNPCMCNESLVFKHPILRTKYIDFKIVILKRGKL